MFQIFAMQSIAMTVGVLCTPAISLLYAATLNWYIGTVYLFTAGIVIIAVLNTLYVYGYLKNLEKKAGKETTSSNQNIFLEANDTLEKMAGLTTVV